MAELVVDFITSLDGYGAAEGWPGWWGFQVPEYLSWLAEQPERHYTILMGATTYRQVSEFAEQLEASGGRGVRLWDGLERLENDYAIEATASPSGVVHVTFSRAAA